MICGMRFLNLQCIIPECDHIVHFFFLNSSFAFSTLSLVRINVMRRLKIIGIHRYMMWSMFMVDAVCWAAPPT